MKFIAITGPDACGKDTQIEKLSSVLKSQGLKVQVLSIQNSLQDFTEFSDIKTLNSILNVFLLKFAPQARSHFLMSLLNNSLAKMDPTSDVVIFNGYWYKYAASEQAYGVSPLIWKQNMDSLRVPDLTIVLQVSWENCLLRRSQWSAYESGLAQQDLDLSTFQTKMRAHLDEIVRDSDAHKIFINGDLNEDSVATEITEKSMPILKAL